MELGGRKKGEGRDSRERREREGISAARMNS